MMLRHFGHELAAEVLLQAIKNVLARSGPVIMTPDMGGHGTTIGFGNEVERELRKSVETKLLVRMETLEV
jgi:isocitrate/isopropylmalate dehydrogenase